MQPDLLSAQEEEKQSEALSPQNTTHAEPISAAEVSQLESRVGEEPPTLKTSRVVEKKRSKLNLVAIALGLLIVVLLAAFAWVGYWAYRLDSELTSTRQQLTSLQAEHAKLTSEYAALTSEQEKLNAELTQTTADLEKANTDLTAAQAELDKSKKQIKDLESKIDMAVQLTEVLYAWTMTDDASDIFKIDTLIKETGNQQLISQWNTFTKSPSDDAFSVFMDYLITAIRNSVR